MPFRDSQILHYFVLFRKQFLLPPTVLRYKSNRFWAMQFLYLNLQLSPEIIRYFSNLFKKQLKNQLWIFLSAFFHIGKHSYQLCYELTKQPCGILSIVPVRTTQHWLYSSRAFWWTEVNWQLYVFSHPFSSSFIGIQPLERLSVLQSPYVFFGQVC